MRTFISGALAALALAACFQTPASAAPPHPADQALGWKACGDGLQCAKLTVPIDWKRPHGPKTQVDIAKMPARDPARKLGSLVVNLGSGASIVKVRSNPAAVSGLTAWFDVILFDPRGYGDEGSDALKACEVPQPEFRELVLASGAAGWRAHAKANAAYDASCRKALGAEYAGTNSWQVAHDVEALRGALDEPQLRYFGNSYGTVYGQMYMRLFPAKIRRMVLDGVPDHTRTSLEKWMTAYARTSERQLENFRDWCAAGCALGDDGDATDLSKVGSPPSTEPAYSSQAMLCHDFMPRTPGYRDFLPIESRLRKAAPRIGWIQGRYLMARCVGMSGEPANPRVRCGSRTCLPC